MTESLTVYLHGRRAGVFTRDGQSYSFAVDEEWAETSDGLEISISLPKAGRRHVGEPVVAYLEGLLPDNPEVLQRWARMFQTSVRPLSLLSHVGLDCAGAVQFSEEVGARLSRDGGVDLVSADEIGRHLGDLRRDPAEWVLPAGHGGCFSLAGAQAKFALQKTAAGWGVPWGSEPSTHIVKPGVAGLPHQDLVEHLTQRVAALLGLRVAASTIEMFGAETAIVVERYDRVETAAGEHERVHQEDFCQALGVRPGNKYQADGGPGVVAAAGLLKDVLRGSLRRHALDDFVDASAFNWLVAGTDAHAKNFSLLHTERGPTSAPFYDLASVLPYLLDSSMNERRVTLAMSLDHRYRVFDIEPRHVARQAAAVGVDPDRTLRRLAGLAEGLPRAAELAAAELDGLDVDHDFVGIVVRAFVQRAEAVNSRL